MKKIFVMLLLIIILNFPLIAETNSTSNINGNKFNFEITTGLQGVLSFAQFGINLPQFIPHFLIGFKFRGMSCLT